VQDAVGVPEAVPARRYADAVERPDVARAVRSFGVVPVAVLAAEVERASDVASRRLSWVVAGLVVLAGVITVVTALYWRATRPPRVPDPFTAMRWVADEPASDPAPPPSTSTAPTRPTPPPPDPSGVPAPTPRPGDPIAAAPRGAERAAR